MQENLRSDPSGWEVTSAGEEKGHEGRRKGGRAGGETFSPGEGMKAALGQIWEDAKRAAQGLGGEATICI